jgi:tellurite resistance protein
MHDQDLAIVRALVPVAWADGEYSPRERETLEGLLAAYDATPEEKERILGFAAEKKTLDDIDLQELSAEDRRVLLQHAVLLTFADGAQKPEEAQFLHLLAERLKIPADEATSVMEAASERAKKLLHFL